MNTLSQILSSRTRAEIFKLLFGTREEELDIWEIQRRTKLYDRTILSGGTFEGFNLHVFGGTFFARLPKIYILLQSKPEFRRYIK